MGLFNKLSSPIVLKGSLSIVGVQKNRGSLSIVGVRKK